MLEDRLEEISRTGKVKAHRAAHLIPTAADAASGMSAASGSEAKDKLCALCQRIQLKESATSGAGSQEVPESIGDSQLPLPL